MPQQQDYLAHTDADVSPILRGGRGLKLFLAP